MNITVKQGEIQAEVADAVIVNLFKGVVEPSGATGAVDKVLNGAISELIEGGDLSGKLGQTVVLYPRGAIPARRVIVVGLGEATDFTLESVREAAAKAILTAQQLGAKTIATIVHGGGIGGLRVTEAAQATVEGSLLALYKYDAPLANKEEDEEKEVEALTLVEFDTAKMAQIEMGAHAGQVIAESVYMARTLVNQPSNVATPSAIAEAAQNMCVQYGLACQILDETQMQEQHMELLLAVTQGASQPAKFIVMEHKPKGSTNAGPIILVGKGVAFDTGGYSLKPGDSMVGMKGDMGGAAAVIGTMQAVARLSVPYHIVGLVPTVENMVSSTAYKPNDVFKAKNGVTVEIISTDAEGRLILADALCYADTLSPVAVIDIATLTGGKVVALGNRTNALFVNDEGIALGERLLAAGQKVGEPLWRLPLTSDYDRQLKSKVADLKNTGGRSASAVTAARFLAHFSGDWPWAHLDIAGSELYQNDANDTARAYLTAGATGIPLRTLVELLRNWVE